MSDPPSADLQAAVEHRKIWFHECHVRGLNLESLREPGPDRRDELSKFYTRPSGKTLDDLPVWSDDELKQRDALQTTMIGKTADWLAYRQPKELLAKLTTAQKQYADNLDSTTPPEGLPGYRPIYPAPPGAAPISADATIMHRVSRLELTDRKPWLLQDLFGSSPSALSIGWLNEMVDVFPELQKLVDPQVSAASPWAEAAALSALTRKAKNVDITFLDKDKKFLISLATPATKSMPGGRIDIGRYPSSPLAWFWIIQCQDSLKSLYLMEENSDMGLTHLVRVLYLYGTLPEHLAAAQFPARKRRFDAHQQELLARISPPPADLDALVGAFKANANTSAVPCCDFRFSLLAEEIIKQTLLRSRYWLDEPFRVVLPDGDSSKNPPGAALNAARAANGVDQQKDMQYWSENHYIMFASCEYLIGQLWPDATFQPGQDFLPPGSDFGKLSGAQRRDRGKWRVLKYLNNRLTFGWTEWTTGGYYREHLWALLNLVDFSLDEEVRVKASMALDLMLFDIARFSFRGANGAAGGRVQFKWKRSGWDQAIGDLVEIAFGTRGAFNDANSEMGAFTATTGYKIPDVLLEIGSHPPPDGFVDRTRVSITFEEAPKYGIGFSETSRQRESQEQGYKERLARYSPHIDEVNQGLAATHTNYGKREDDTVFWWTMSAWFTHQTIDDTFDMVGKWGLSQTDPFKGITAVFGDVWAVPEDLGLAVGGFAVGSAAGAAVGLAGPAGLAGAALGVAMFGSAPNVRSLSAWGKVALYGLAAALGPVGIVLAIKELGNPFSSEQQASDLSVMVEGSVRTRGNIYTYRSRDVMLSSTQNFRGGQINYQNDVNRATLSCAVSAFTTAPFVGVRLSDLLGAAIGGLMLGPVGAIGGAIATEEFINQSSKDAAGIVDHDDGPGWWTGYFCLPRVIQYRNAAILFYRYPWLQRTLSDHDTHLFLPESGLTEHVEIEPNRDHLDDTDSPLEDIGEFFSNIVSRKHGIWLFGRVLHETDVQNPTLDQEAYIGVFSESRWDKLDKDHRFYKDQVTNELGKNTTLLTDYFKDRDRYATGDSVWIVQVGNKAEYGSFEAFKDRLVNTHIKLDVDDMTCTFDMPMGDGSTTSVSVKPDDGSFQVNGADFSVDRYPRFENPKYIRGTVVEWGQRDYTIEYNNKALTHSLSDFRQPSRSEGELAPGHRIRAIAMYLRTQNENLDIFSVCRGNVTIACRPVIRDDILAVGEIAENTDHDVEWLYFDEPVDIAADMTIELKHPPALSGSNAEPHWRMSFQMKALMDDNRLINCLAPLDPSPIAVSTGKHEVANYGSTRVYRDDLQLNFEGRERSSGVLPFSVARDVWQDWQLVDEAAQLTFLERSGQVASGYFDHSLFVGLDSDGAALIRTVSTCPDVNRGWQRMGSETNFGKGSHLAAYEPQPDRIIVFGCDGSTLKCIEKPAGRDWTALAWQPLSTNAADAGTTRAVVLNERTRMAIDSSLRVVLGSGGALYTLDWDPDYLSKPWQVLPLAAGMSLADSVNFAVCEGVVVLIDDAGKIWAGWPGMDSETPAPVFSWSQIGPSEAFVVGATAGFTAIDVDGTLRKICVVATDGAVWTCDVLPGSEEFLWQRIGADDNFRAAPTSSLASMNVQFQKLCFAVTDENQQLYLTRWDPSGGWQGWLRRPSNEPVARFWLVSRVQGELEVYARAADQPLFWTWWS